MLPAACQEVPEPIFERSSNTTSRSPRWARCQAMLVPTTPAPITTIAAWAGRVAVMGRSRSAHVAGAVDVDGGAGGVARQAGGQEQHRVGDVLGLGDLAQRDVARRPVDAVLGEEGGV